MLADFEVKKVKTTMIQKVRIKISVFTLKNSINIFRFIIPCFDTFDTRFLYFEKKRKNAIANPMYCEIAVPRATPLEFIFNTKTKNILSKIFTTFTAMAIIMGKRAFCIPKNQPLNTNKLSAAGAAQTRIRK